MLHPGLEITVPALASAAFAAGGEVRLEGVAEEAAAQPPMPRALWEAIAGLVAAITR